MHQKETKPLAWCHCVCAITEFGTDEENLEAWRAEFGQPHFWSAELGPVLALGLSTTRYRSNISRWVGRVKQMAIRGGGAV